jgi:transposase
VKKLPTFLTFQDEARFGRLSSPRSCWAPEPFRPVVNACVIRQFRYIYGCVSPQDGSVDYMVAEQMNTDGMSKFLRQVSHAHRNKYVIMVVDGASSHKSKTHKIPNNMELLILLPYSPELNPAERLWNSVRRDRFVNRYFETLDEAIKEAKNGMADLKRNKKDMISLLRWPWIEKAIVKNNFIITAR